LVVELPAALHRKKEVQMAMAKTHPKLVAFVNWIEEQLDRLEANLEYFRKSVPRIYQRVKRILGHVTVIVGTLIAIYVLFEHVLLSYVR
jgi:hypothetical protein